MFKLFFSFLLLNWLFGNPIVALLVLLAILYFLDRRFLGLSPSFIKPLRRMRKISRLKQQIALSPNDVSSKLELARLLIERKKFSKARELLEPLQETMEHSAEFWDDLGTSRLFTGDPGGGVAAVERALELNARVKYGAPYLRLAALHSRSNTERALHYLQQFQSIQSSSCEAYYRLAAVYKEMDRKEDAAEALGEGLRIYRSLPRYKKRQERGWALRLWLRKLT
ncbi:tetratricopeptide repeat protein [Paenibacillus sp. GCM10023252]|uniref:tetratricopeptide repeat protein n=1 Tax=Paenibacillus sp. GCM10023252 TaxID=3252649 RepID=UPI0036156391